MRQNVFAATAAIAIGKFARYLAIAEGVRWFAT
jgi:membrane protein YqaA with SNARE-associated domain